MIAGLTAYAAAVGRTEPPPPDLIAVARVEGWIALPDPDLDALRHLRPPVT